MQYQGENQMPKDPPPETKAKAYVDKSKVFQRETTVKAPRKQAPKPAKSTKVAKSTGKKK